MTWYNSLWLWRWLPHRLSKRQSLSTTTVLFRTTFTRTIKLNLLNYYYYYSDSRHLKKKEINYITTSASPERDGKQQTKQPLVISFYSCFLFSLNLRCYRKKLNSLSFWWDAGLSRKGHIGQYHRLLNFLFRKACVQPPLFLRERVGYTQATPRKSVVRKRVSPIGRIDNDGSRIPQIWRDECLSLSSIEIRYLNGIQARIGPINISS